MGCHMKHAYLACAASCVQTGFFYPAHPNLLDMSFRGLLEARSRWKVSQHAGSILIRPVTVHRLSRYPDIHLASLHTDTSVLKVFCCARSSKSYPVLVTAFRDGSGRPPHQTFRPVHECHSGTKLTRCYAGNKCMWAPQMSCTGPVTARMCEAGLFKHSHETIVRKASIRMISPWTMQHYELR